MQIYLKKLTLTNFKGIRSFSVNLNHITNIYGDNATGKTSLMDAFLWLLFNKDSTDRKDFEIKTLDENNQPYHRLDHEVEGVLMIDGVECVLRKTYREKWTKPRGKAEQEFTGHETVYYWNDVPMKQDAFQAKIAELLNENIFKLITNTTYFNNLKWQDRRAVLLQIAGVIDDVKLLHSLGLPADQEVLLMEAYKAGKGKDNFKEFKSELSAKKKKLKDQLDLMPARIDEAKRSLPEVLDYDAIQQNIDALTKDIDDVDGLLMNKSAATKKHQEKISDLLAKKQGHSRLMMEIEFSIKQKVSEAGRNRIANISDQEAKLRQLNTDLANARKEYMTADSRKKQLEMEQQSLRDQWAKVDAEQLVFKEGEFCCPACKREFEPHLIEEKKAELTANFNSNKTKRLTDITERGKAIGEEITQLTTQLGNLKAKGDQLNIDIENQSNHIEELKVENDRLSADDAAEEQRLIAEHAQYQQCKKDVAEIEAEMNAPYVQEDNSALLQRKKELAEQKYQLQKQLDSKELREKQLTRIAELEAQESTMANELASLEGVEFSIEQFTKAKMDELESRINGRFKIVRFKMFEEQINGGQVEACTTLINGVPYADANTAAKIQAGLDIINTLSEHYDVQAPVWVDNRESVVRLPETNCQLINLIVSASDKKLRVEEPAHAMATA